MGIQNWFASRIGPEEGEEIEELEGPSPTPLLEGGVQEGNWRDLGEDPNLYGAAGGGAIGGMGGRGAQGPASGGMGGGAQGPAGGMGGGGAQGPAGGMGGGGAQGPASGGPADGRSRSQAQSDERASAKERTLRETQLDAAIAKSKREMLARDKAKQELLRSKQEYRRTESKSASEGIRRGMQMGGISMTPEDRRSLYFGKVNKSQKLYGPSAPKAPFRGMGAAEALRPDVSEEAKDLHRFNLSGLRGKADMQVVRGQTSDVAYGRELVTPSKDLRSGLNFGFLRELSSPRSLNMAEQSAYAEIRANGDRDTARHVVGELGKLGISRGEAEGALRSLLSGGHVRKVQDFSGEAPIFEIIDKASQELSTPAIQARSISSEAMSPIQQASIQSALQIGTGGVRA